MIKSRGNFDVMRYQSHIGAACYLDEFALERPEEGSGWRFAVCPYCAFVGKIPCDVNGGNIGTSVQWLHRRCNGDDGDRGRAHWYSNLRGLEDRMREGEDATGVAAVQRARGEVIFCGNCAYASSESDVLLHSWIPELLTDPLVRACLGDTMAWHSLSEDEQVKMDAILLSRFDAMGGA